MIIDQDVRDAAVRLLRAASDSIVLDDEIDWAKLDKDQAYALATLVDEAVTHVRMLVNWCAESIEDRTPGSESA